LLLLLLLGRIACSQDVRWRSVATDVARSVVCLSVCVLSIWVSCAKMSETIEMPFGGLTHVGPRNHVLDYGQDRMNPFVATRQVGDAAFCQITLNTCYYPCRYYYC